MTYLLIIFFYLISSVVDVMDKVLLSARKIRPLTYTFFTVVMGLILLLAWPWVYEPLGFSRILLDVFSGVLFSVAMYLFFKAVSEGEVSRVVPFIFAVVPLTDLLVSVFTGANLLSIKEFSALCLLLPGAFLIAYKKEVFSSRHILLKVLSALLWSIYYAVWQYSATGGNVLNHLMWNRLGAALPVVLLLALPVARRNILGVKNVEKKKQTSLLFFLKQILGGVSFVFLSFLLVFSKISVVNGLQGFRYIFLFLFALILSYTHQHLLQEQLNKKVIWQKFAAICLIFGGTIILFV
ncbi:MAG: EamA family transporter [Candidatus Doudnabacteria bacterium]|nr:EamA family transporter [Candidatus Doudnabacteria bacterium]